MRVLPLLIIAALGVSLTGCAGPATSGDGNSGEGTSNGDTGTSGNEGTEDATGLPDPCSLVTQDEVAAAVGAPVGVGAEATPGPNSYAFGQGRQCQFIPENSLNSPTFVAVYPYSADGWVAYQENQASFSTYHEVAGIGEEALSAGVGQIGIHQGDLVLDIGMGFDTPQDPAGDARLLTLANSALGRL